MNFQAKLIGSLEIIVECDEDKICQGFREFYATGELTIPFDEILIHTLMDFDINQFEKRKYLAPKSAKSFLTVKNFEKPEITFRSFKNSQLESKLMFY